MDSVSRGAGWGFGQSLVLGFCIFGIAGVISSTIIAHGYVKSKDAGMDTLTVSGIATRVIESDRVKWSVQLSRNTTSTKEAMRLLTQDGTALRDFLKAGHAETAEISFQPMTANDSYQGFASQVVVIESDQPALIGALAQSAASSFAVQQGAVLNTTSIEFYNTTLDQIEKELGVQALSDAREQAASLMNKRLGDVQYVNAPQFAVTPEQAGQTSYYSAGQDTSSLRKKVTATLQVAFHLN